MSHFIIKDGTGSGNTALVDDHGRLFVRATAINPMGHHATYHKNAYIKSFETTLAGSTLSPCAFFHNTDTGRDVEIYWLRVSSNAAVQVDIVSDNDYTSGGTAVEMINTNLGSPSALTADVYEGGASGDLVLSTTNGSLFDGFFLKENERCFCDFEGGIVLGYTRSLAIKIKGAAGDKIKITLGVALHEAGAKL